MDGLESPRVRQNLDDDNYILTKIGRWTIKALVDTGAHHSCVSLSFIRRIRKQKLIVNSANQRRLFSANGKPMRVIGTIQLTLDFNNLTVPITFCVLDHLHHDIILGMDFLKQTNANIDIPSKVVTLYDGLVGVNLTRPADVILRTVDAVLIPPRSEALIPVSVPPYCGSVLSIIEPSIKLSNKNLTLARTIVIPKQDRTACKILNPTDVPIFLRHRTVIGVIDKISIESINVIDNLLPCDSETKEETSPITLDDQLKVISCLLYTSDAADE